MTIRLLLVDDQTLFREGLTTLLAAQPGTPGWLKAACEYETAELYGALEETDRAIAALGGAVRLGFDAIPGLADNRHCAAGLSAVQIAAASIRAGMDRVVRILTDHRRLSTPEPPPGGP